MVELHISMDKMAPVQQNREMNHEKPKHDKAPVINLQATWTLMVPTNTLMMFQTLAIIIYQHHQENYQKSTWFITILFKLGTHF